MTKMKNYFMRSLNEMTVIKYKERRCLIVSRTSNHKTNQKAPTIHTKHRGLQPKCNAETKPDGLKPFIY